MGDKPDDVLEYNNISRSICKHKDCRNDKMALIDSESELLYVDVETEQNNANAFAKIKVRIHPVTPLSTRCSYHSTHCLSLFVFIGW